MSFTFGAQVCVEDPSFDFDMARAKGSTIITKQNIMIMRKE
jgi:hypothetical protein